MNKCIYIYKYTQYLLTCISTRTFKAEREMHACIHTFIHSYSNAYITLHQITLHYTTVHLHLHLHLELHYICNQNYIHYICNTFTVHLHDITLQYITLQYMTSDRTCSLSCLFDKSNSDSKKQRQALQIFQFHHYYLAAAPTNNIQRHPLHTDAHQHLLQALTTASNIKDKMQGFRLFR